MSLRYCIGCGKGMTDEVGGSTEYDLCRTCWAKKQRGTLESTPVHRSDRLAEIWCLLDGLPELTGDARAYYEACSSRSEAGLASPVDRTDTAVARMLGWSRPRVKKAREALTKIIRPYH